MSLILCTRQYVETLPLPAELAACWSSAEGTTPSCDTCARLGALAAAELREDDTEDQPVDEMSQEAHPSGGVECEYGHP